MQSSLDGQFAISGQHVPDDHVDSFESRIIESLTRLAREGFPEDEVDAAVNQIDFTIRRDTGSDEQGFNFAESVLRTWMHGKDPFAHMAAARTLSVVQER
jgi:Zn-dependent M16 (insulinase) family peptidase